MSRPFLLVGLTGGIATGKSTVSAMFRDLGCVVIDADVLAREVVAPGQAAHAAIVREFGPVVLQPDGTLDRKRLGAIVFADPARRKRLEAITHPAIRERLAARLAELAAQGFRGIVIFDAPVIVESGNYRTMDRLVVVAADEATQEARLVARDGVDGAEARRRIASQMPIADKARLADYVIDNTGDPDRTRAQVQWVHQSLERELHAADRVTGTALPLLALFFRNAEHYGRNKFNPRVVARHFLGAQPVLSWIAYHRHPPSAALMIRDPGPERRQAVEAVGRQVTGLVCVSRTFADLARLERALPGDARTTARGKVVVRKGDHQRNVVAVFLTGSVESGLKVVRALTPRVETLAWTSDRDVACLYDRPPRSGSNGQVERTVRAFLAENAGKRTEIVGTARAMSVIRDILDGRLETIDRKVLGGSHGETGTEDCC